MACLKMEERLHDFSLVVILAMSSTPNLVMNEEAFETKDGNQDNSDSSQHKGNYVPEDG